MGHPLVHAIVLICAIVIPGGLLVYLGWRAAKRCKKDSQKPTSVIEQARNAFEEMYPPESLRLKSRRAQLERARRTRKFRRNQDDTP